MARNDVVFAPGDSQEPGSPADADLVDDTELVQDMTVADGDLPGLDPSPGDDAEDAPAADSVSRRPGMFARLPRPRMTPAVTLSLAAHVVLAAAFLPAVSDDMQIAGGEEVNVTIIGADFLDALKAGENVSEVEADTEAAEISETLEPVETARLEPVAEPGVEPVAQAPFLPVAEPVAQPVVEPVAAEAVPQEAAAAPAPVEQEAVAEPAAAQAAPDPKPRELAAIPDPADDQAVTVPEPVGAVTPVEAIPEIANVPIPQPRPEPPKVEVAKAVTPQAERPKVSPKPERQAEAPARKPQKAAKASQAKPAKPARAAKGDGGAQAATTNKGSSGGKPAGKSSQAGNAAVSNYPGKVASKLRRSLRYPREARGGKLRGEVLVSFVVGSNGSVSSVRVARSSGSPILDQAAGDAVRRAAPFPPIPADAGRSNWSFSVPLAFTR